MRDRERQRERERERQRETGREEDRERMVLLEGKRLKIEGEKSICECII